MLALVFCLFVPTGPVDLEDLCARREIAWTADAGTGRHVLRAGRLTAVFSPGTSTALVNGAPVRLSAPVQVLAGRVKVPPDLARMLDEAAPSRPKLPAIPTAPRPEVRPSAPPPVRDLPITVVIDAGHGGMHTGGKGRTGLLEKDINLDVSLHLQRILESWGATVIMTRVADQHFSADVDDDLNHRVLIANRAQPDLFVSIHTNWVDHSGARGFEVWVPKNAAGSRDAESRRLARHVLKELGQVWTSDDRGIKDDVNLRVLRGTRCPAALVELEFVSNPHAERQLARSEVRRSLAEAVARAVRGWAGR